MTEMPKFMLEMYQKHFLNNKADSFIPRLTSDALTKSILQLVTVAEEAKRLSVAERSVLTWNTLEAAKQLREAGWNKPEIELLYNFAQAINQSD